MHANGPNLVRRSLYAVHSSQMCLTMVICQTWSGNHCLQYIFLTVTNAGCLLFSYRMVASHVNDLTAAEIICALWDNFVAFRAKSVGDVSSRHDA